jgi:hypothetical protein
LWSDDRLPDEHTTEHHYDIFFQHLPSGAREAHSNSLLFRAPYVQEKPRASFNAQTGEIWAIWHSYEGFGSSASHFAVQITHFPPRGELPLQPSEVSAGLGDYPLPDVACSSVSGDCLAIWNDDGPVYRLHDRGGDPLGPVTRLHSVVSPWPLHSRVIASDSALSPQFMMTFSHGGQVFYGALEDRVVTPTPTPTTTLTPTSKATITRTPTPSPTPTALGDPDLSSSDKVAQPPVAKFYQEVTYAITLRNTGSGLAQVSITDDPPLFYTAGSASGGLWWDDSAGLIRWEGELSAGETRQFTYTVHGPSPPLAHDTLLCNSVTINDGVHPPFERQASVLANPRPTASATPSSTPTLPVVGTPTATTPPDGQVRYLPLLIREGGEANALDYPQSVL